MDDPKISIALGVYNGAHYLEQQVASYFSQNFQRWNLLARDDHSQDHSLHVLKCMVVNNDRITLVQEGLGNQGVTKNFGTLLEEGLRSSCQYVALSDQDDVWGQDKLSEQLSLMRLVEEKHPGKPVLVYSDLEVVNESLNLIAPSYMKYQGIKHEASNPLRVLLAQNFVTGCTILVNRQLLEMALPIPDEAVIHDWWLALCAATFGEIAYVNKPLVKYRQHGNNEVGAKSLLNLLNPFKNNYFKFWCQGRDRILGSMHQARALADRTKNYDCSNPDLPLIEAYAQLDEFTPLQRVKKLRELGIHAQSKLRHLLMLSRLINLSEKKKG